MQICWSIVQLFDVDQRSVSRGAVFGIVGVEFYQGVLHHRCVAHDAATHRPQSAASAVYMSARGAKSRAETRFCAANASACGGGGACHVFDSNPEGVTFGNFDSIRGAAVVLLQAMTFEGWAALLYTYADALPDLSSFTYAYFDVATMLGGFFFVNMFVAVIFDEVMRSVELVRVMEHAEATSVSLAAPSSPDREDVPGATAKQQSAAQQRSTPTSLGTPALISSRRTRSRRMHSHTEGLSLARPLEATDCCGFDSTWKPIGYVTAFAIGANILLMSLPYRGMPRAYRDQLNRISYVFSGYFGAEALLKLWWYGRGDPSIGWQQYWHLRDDYRWNRLDFSVLVVDACAFTLELLLVDDAEDITDGGTSTDAHVTSIRVLRVFRALRVLRAFKLSHVWEPLTHTLQTMYRAAAPVSSLAVLILLFTLMFALLGKELLGGSGLVDISRAHFDAPLPALLSIMVIFSGEDWVGFLNAAATTADSSSVVLFVIAALLLGHLVIVNLFVAVLVEAFVHDEQDRRRNDLLGRRAQFEEKDSACAISTDSLAPEAPGGGHTGHATNGFSHASSREPRQLESHREGSLPLHGITCLCCSKQSAFRRLCRQVLLSSPWELLVLMLVVASCIHLAVDNPNLDPDSEEARRLVIANYVLTAMFTLEAAMKITVQGFVMSKTIYLRSAWNALDFFILLTSLVALATPDMSSGVVRLLRVLRPLRLVSRVPGMASIFTFFIQAAGEVANVSGVVIFFQLIFAVIGMELCMEASSQYLRVGAA